MRRRLVLSAVVSLLALWGCSKFKVAPFVAPTWDTQFSAPLFDRTYTLGEILYKDSVTTAGGDTTYLDTTSSGIFEISRSQAIKGIPVGDNLEMASVPGATFSQTQGDFTIDSPDSIHYGIPNKVPANTTTLVPKFQSDTSLAPTIGFKNYASATISNGVLHLAIHNGYPAPVWFANGKIYILDAAGNPISLPVDTVQPNSTWSADISLNYHTLSQSPNVSFTYGSDGLPPPQTATYESDTLLAISMSFSKLEVSKAFAKVPQQNPIALSQSIVLVAGTKVNTANIKSGELDLTITNGFNMSLSPVDLVINSLDSQGVALKRTFNLDSGQSISSTIDLSGWQLNMSDAGVPTDSLHYTITVGIPGSNNRFVDVDSSNSVNATFGMSNLVFSYFSGVIHPLNTFEIANDTQPIDLGDFKKNLTGGITLEGDSTKLDLKIRSAGFPYLVHLSLKPFSSVLPNPAVDSVDTFVVIRPDQPNIVGIGSSFVRAINNFAIREQKIPDEFIIGGSAIVNPQTTDLPANIRPLYTLDPNAIGTIADTDKINITNTITMPLEIGIVNGSYTDMTSKPAFDSSLSAKLGEVDSGDVHFDITNGLPLQLKFIPQLVDTSYADSVTTLDSIVVAAALLDNNGIVTMAIPSQNKIMLSPTQAKKFSRSYLKFNFSVITPVSDPTDYPNGGQPVPFSKDYSIRLKVYADLTFKVDKNLTGGK